MSIGPRLKRKTFLILSLIIIILFVLLNLQFPSLNQFNTRNSSDSSIIQEYVILTVTETSYKGKYSCLKDHYKDINDIQLEIKQYEQLNDQVALNIKTSGSDQDIIDNYEAQSLQYTQHIRELIQEFKLAIDEYCE